MQTRTGATERVGNELLPHGYFHFNSLGFHPQEKIIYGIQGKNVYRVFGDGSFEYVVELSGEAEYYAGTFDDSGKFWFGDVVRSGYLDLVPGSSSYGQYQLKTLNFWSKRMTAATDIGFSSDMPGYLYTMVTLKDENEALLRRYSMSKGGWEDVYSVKVSEWAESKGGELSGVISINNGLLHVIHADGRMYKFPIAVDDKESWMVLNSTLSDIQDATECIP